MIAFVRMVDVDDSGQQVRVSAELDLHHTNPILKGEPLVWYEHQGYRVRLYPREARELVRVLLLAADEILRERGAR